MTSEHIRPLLRSERFLFTIVAAIAFLGYAAMWHVAPRQVPDSADYIMAAQNLTSQVRHLQPRTPGFPLAIAIFGVGRALLYAQFILHIASVGMLFFALKSVGVRRSLRWGFCITTLLPPFVQAAAIIGTEIVCEFWLCVGFTSLFTWVRRRESWLLLVSGASFALAALTRPTYQLVAVMIAILLLLVYRSRPFRAAMVLVACTVVLVGGYIAYNAINFRYAGLSYFIGYNLSTRTTTLYPDIPDREVRTILLDNRNAMYALGENPFWAVFRARASLKDVKGPTEVDLSRYLTRMNLRLIATHPLGYAQQVAEGFATYWFPYYTAVMGKFWRVISYPIQILLSLGFWAATLIVAGHLAARLMFRQTRPGELEGFFWYILPAAIVLYTAVISCAVDWGDPRYRSVTDIFIVFTIVGTVEWTLKMRQLTKPGRLNIELSAPEICVPKWDKVPQ